MREVKMEGHDAKEGRVYKKTMVFIEKDPTQVSREKKKKQEEH